MPETLQDNLRTLMTKLERLGRASNTNFLTSYINHLVYAVEYGYKLKLHKEDPVAFRLDDDTLIIYCQEGIFQFWSDGLEGARLIERKELVKYVVTGCHHGERLEVKAPWRKHDSKERYDYDGEDQRELLEQSEPHIDDRQLDLILEGATVVDGGDLHGLAAFFTAGIQEG